MLFMASESSANVPGPFGGLVRYDSEYKSKLTIEPTIALGFAILVLVFVLALKIFWPIAAT